MNKLLADYKKKPVVPIGLVNGVMGLEDNEEFSSTDESDGDDYEQYEQEYVTQEMNKYAKCSTDPSKFDSMSEVDGVDGIDYKNNPLNVYSNYNFTKSIVKRELPIDSYREKILNLLEVNNVLIIQGPTGCGKTTQVPQYILDHYKKNNEICNIAVTQPRKIATITVARRVCEERGWTLGTVCGYQVGLEKKVQPDVLLTYMTTGVLLQKLIHYKSLNQFTHIIIDEIHERNQDLDFLLLIVRRFLFTNSPRTKVILMSATIEAEEFAYYFRTPSISSSIQAPIIFVNKKSSFRNTVFYLENLGQAVESTQCTTVFEADTPEISDGIWRLFTLLVHLMDKVDEVHPVTNKKIIGSILVFLPGINEIEEANRCLTAYYEQERKRGKDGTPSIQWEMIPLHSSLPNDEQALAFKPARAGVRKIILSTNIAESSVTISDSYYVIDFCLTKVMTVDPVTKYMSLKLEWASHVNCEQRAGRVGRIASGRVYRLVTRRFYMECLSERSIPEMLRAPLERIVLQAKMLNLNDTPQQILALAMNPPNLRNIEMTILVLKEVGGLLQTCRGTFTQTDGDVTFLGTVMASLPIDVRLSKLIILGHLFNCLEEAIIMAAGCSIQNIFSTPFQQRLNAYKKLLLWADGSCSDLIALYNLFQVWNSLKRDNKFDNYHAELRWCATNLVSLKGLREWNLLVTEIKQRLELMNVKSIPGQVHLSIKEKPLILKVITAGAFYPNFFIKEVNSTQADEREAVKSVGGRNPFRTVFLTGMDPTQPCPIYISAIKDLFRNEREGQKDMAVGFDGSSRIYVEFKGFDKKEQVTVSVAGRQMVTDTIPGRIPTAVYESIRKRQLRYPFALKVLPHKEAWKFAEKNGIQRKSMLQKLNSSGGSSDLRERHCYSEEYDFSPIPSLDTEHITLKITEFIDAGNFWVNVFESEKYLGTIEELLNQQILHAVPKPQENVKVGKIYATKFFEDNQYYRCQVISTGPDIIQVLFIDYGNTQQVKPSDLYMLPDRPECNMPPLGVECVLHGVQPSLQANPMGVWSEKVNQHWKNQMYGFLLFGQVHSVVHDVVHLVLFKTDPRTKESMSINQQMVNIGHAEPAVESFLSKANHETRLQVSKADNPNLEAIRMSFDKVENYGDFATPTFGSNFRILDLKGPHSPMEMRLYGCIETASNKTVDIEGQSVNTVLLDSEPQEYHTRLLVASCVTQSASGNRLNLRSTTLMPNIPGLPMLLALIFCPTMRVKVTDDGTRVASILCGLGFNMYTHKPYYPAHDLVLTLDTELTEAEITKINTIRFYMNQGVKLMYELTQEVTSEEEMIKTQAALKKDLTELIYAKRKPVDRANVKFANVWAKNNTDNVTLKPIRSDDTEDIWPLLWFVRLRDTTSYSADISKNLDDLDLMARDMIPIDDALCQLCEVPLHTVTGIRFHIISKEHKMNVAQFLEALETNEDDDDDKDDACEE